MRKRFVTTLFICMLSLACIFSFTACGNGNPDTPDDEVPKSKEVTEKEWKEAIEATLEANNYTADVDYEYESAQNETVLFSTAKYAMQYSYDKQTQNGDSYISINGKATMTGAEGEMEITEKIYNSLEKTTLWTARYYKAESEEVKWEANKYECREDNAKYYLTSDIGLRESLGSDFFTEKENDGENGKKLADLFSSFTYSNGKYTANLFGETEEDGSCAKKNIVIAIADGYVTEFEYDYLYEYDIEGNAGKEHVVYTYHLKDYGKTSKPQAPAEATEAINKAKEEAKQ